MDGQVEPLLADVLPDVELGPVRDGEDPDVLTRPVPAVVERPQLGTLVLRVPLAELVAEASTPAPWPGPSPRPAGRRRSTASNLCSVMASSRVRVWSRLRDGSGPPSSVDRPASIESCTEATTSLAPSSATVRSRNSSTSGKLCPVSMCMTGNGMRPGQKAFWARRSMTTESLPPENSSTGRSNSAATSRMMWIDAASMASQVGQLVLALDRASPCRVHDRPTYPTGNLTKRRRVGGAGPPGAGRPGWRCRGRRGPGP